MTAPIYPVLRLCSIVCIANEGHDRNVAFNRGIEIQIHYLIFYYYLNLILVDHYCKICNH